MEGVFGDTDLTHDAGVSQADGIQNILTAAGYTARQQDNKNKDSVLRDI